MNVDGRGTSGPWRGASPRSQCGGQIGDQVVGVLQTDREPDEVRGGSDVRRYGAVGERGRVLVRYSGTQSMCRVMVEGPTEAVTREACARISAVVRRELA